MNGKGAADVGPLQGIKVLDCTTSGVGPIMNTYLGSFGAEVVKIESSMKPDIMRMSTPYKDGIVGMNRSGGFNTMNSSKHSMALDMKHPRKGEVVQRLIKWADVIVESYAVGVKERWDIDYASVSRINPAIIMISTTAQGQTGPCSKHPAWGWNLKGLCGFTELTGWPDREGTAPYPAYTDYVAPWFGIVSILTALDYRRRTGRGQFIDLSQLEAASHFIAPAILDYTVNGRVQKRAGNSSPRACPHNCYRCQGEDRWCVIAVFTDEEWESLCQAMGAPALAKDARFATMMARRRNESELDQIIGAWTQDRPAEEVMSLLQQVGVRAGVVQNSQDIWEDVHLRARGFYDWLEHPEIGKYEVTGFPFKFSGITPKFKRAPCLGEHNEYVCVKLLGMSDEEFVDLLQSGLFV